MLKLPVISAGNPFGKPASIYNENKVEALGC